jgi:hypothetical protein
MKKMKKKMKSMKRYKIKERDYIKTSEDIRKKMMKTMKMRTMKMKKNFSQIFLVIKARGLLQLEPKKMWT